LFGVSLGLALFAGLGAFGIWTEISSQHSPHNQTDRRASNHADAEIDPRKPDERIADYTLWLERFTGLLALITTVQIGFLIRADRTARTSADAAKLAAEVIPKIERAYIFVKVQLRDAPSPFPEITIDVGFYNHGKTPALITKLRAYPAILTTAPQRLNEFPGSENEVPQGLAVTAGGVYWTTVAQVVDQESYGQIKSGEITLFCVGRIEYDDILGSHNETGFCWQFFDDSIRGYGFTICPHTKLNYYT
jgi:hypothetical protein